MNWIKITIKTCFIILTTLSCIAFIEVSIKNFSSSHQDSYLDDWMKSKPRAFRNESNFINILKSLDGSCKWPTLLHKDGTSIYSNDFSCGGLTYKNGKRVTLPIINKWKKTIHVFGGSTVLGTGAGDALTIPSILQKALIDDQVRLLNYGVSSYVTKQQNGTLIAFKNDVAKGDIVIYFDGGNDFWNGVMLGNFNGDMVGSNQTNKYQLYIFIIRGWLSQNSYTYRLMSDIKHGRKRSTNSCDVDSDAIMKRVSQAAIIYSDNVNEARLISESLGAKFFHFYQPTLLDSTILTTYEEEVLSHNPCWQLASTFKKNYNNIFIEDSEESVDLSNILAGKDLFFDYIHTSSEGNKLIGDSILKHIKEK